MKKLSDIIRRNRYKQTDQINQIIVEQIPIHIIAKPINIILNNTIFKMLIEINMDNIIKKN